MNVATCIRRCVADAGLGLRLEPERSEENGRKGLRSKKELQETRES
jgi:hypothetical protein